jgi:hypothetical protein
MKYVLLLFLIFSFCYADICNLTASKGIIKAICDLDKRQNEVEKTIDSLDNFEKKTLQDAHKFYSDSFDKILAVFGLFITIVLAPGILNWWKGKKYKIKTKKELEIVKKRITDVEKEFKENLDKQEKQNKNKIDILFRLTGKRFFELAMKSLKDNDFFEYFSNMYIFCFCLIGINLNRHDSSNLFIAYERFSEKYEKNKNDIQSSIRGIEDIFFKFIVYVLKLIKHCEDTKQNDHLDIAKFIYNKFCDMYSCNDVEKEIENSMKLDKYDDTEIQEILDLAKRYKNE